MRILIALANLNPERLSCLQKELSLPQRSMNFVARKALVGRELGRGSCRLSVMIRTIFACGPESRSSTAYRKLSE